MLRVRPAWGAGTSPRHAHGRVPEEDSLTSLSQREWLLPALGTLALFVGIAAAGSGRHAGYAAEPRHSARQDRFHGPRRAPRIRGDQFSSSTNWSGYDFFNVSNVQSVQGSWTVPSVSASKNNTYSATWVGIDGDGSSTVEQCGTAQDFVGGKPQYYAWYEIYPNPSVNLPSSYAVKAGDLITASVSYQLNGTFLLNMSSSAGWTFSITQSAPGAKRSSAEWIEEAPSNGIGQVLPLANFGTASFSSCQATINGVSSGLGNLWSKYTSSNENAITMVGHGDIKARPSPAPPSDSFYVTWYSSK